MLPQRSFFNPLRHKRTTFIVAIATTMACAVIMGQGSGYADMAKTAVTEFFQLLRSQFSASLS